MANGRHDFCRDKLVEITATAFPKVEASAPAI
jgi:hypothetical protein